MRHDASSSHRHLGPSLHTASNGCCWPRMLRQSTPKVCSKTPVRWLFFPPHLKNVRQSNWESSSPNFGVKIQKNVWDATTKTHSNCGRIGVLCRWQRMRSAEGSWECRWSKAPHNPIEPKSFGAQVGYVVWMCFQSFGYPNQDSNWRWYLVAWKRWVSTHQTSSYVEMSKHVPSYCHYSTPSYSHRT